MNQKWQRDPAFDYEHFGSRHDEFTDEDIDRLRDEPGRLERLFHGMVSIVSRRSREHSVESIFCPGESMQGADFSRKRMPESNFAEADLRTATLTGAFLAGSVFTGADLRGANLAEADMTGTDLRGANLSGANLIGTDFCGADLSGANLGGAYIWGADFNDANLKDCTLSGAYAGGALFSHARNLTLEQFRSTIHDETGAYRLSMLPDPPKSKRA